MLPLTPPKGGSKLDLAVFDSKIQLLSKKVCYKVKTFIGKIVAISFFYLTVHRRIMGDIPTYQTFALKVTHPLRKRQF